MITHYTVVAYFNCSNPFLITSQYEELRNAEGVARSEAEDDGAISVVLRAYAGSKLVWRRAYKSGGEKVEVP